MSHRRISSIIILFLSISIFAQAPTVQSTGEILQQLEKLKTLGSVLYIAAHPDDENTQLISYLSNGMHLRTGYLAATRGDGGQNLIGTEIKEALGVIRTQELLAARKVDGGEQFFSRAVDFGYSKHPDETFNKWDRDKVLSDFVWAIRKFKPDVIVTRFTTEPGITHGHHTASAILAKEAFALSNDPSAYPEQLDYVDLWEVKKIFWNVSTWHFRRSKRVFNPDDYVSIDVGTFNEYLGQSYTEISAKSRSMHKSQGFGRVGSRGAEFEYFEQWGGEDTGDVFGGIEITWDRIPGTEEIKYHINEALLNFDPKNPEAVIPNLLEARKMIDTLSDDFWRKIKLTEVDELLMSLSGTYLEFVADEAEYAPGDSITISFEAINRSSTPITLSGVSFSRWSDSFVYDMDLSENQNNTLDYSLTFSRRVPISNPYWLEEKGTDAMFTVSNQELIGQPENASVVNAKVTMKIEDQFVEVSRPVVFKESDRVKGEVYAPVAITPSVMVNLSSQAIIYASNEPREVDVNVVAGKSNMAGQLKLDVPEGWIAAPAEIPFSLSQKGEERTYTFKLTPPDKASVAEIRAMAVVGDKTYDRGVKKITYDHIPTQYIFPKTMTKAVKLDLEKKGNRIGYIMGAGDEVPQSLEQIGYQVELLEKDQVLADNLAQYDAVILGIRAFNTVDWLAFRNKELFEYAKNGGTVIVQYNTMGMVTDELAPYALKISHDRVAVEEAEVRILVKKHDALYRPNKISNQDFDNWVQERGLYFANEWDPNFEAVISSNDPGESPKDGSLLIAKYGKGYYIYTGLSFFRELPAGVPGAFRLMANLISIGKDNKSK